MELETVTADEFAKAVGVSRWTVYSWIKRGKLPRINLPGEVVRIPRQALEDALRIVNPEPPEAA